MAKHVASTLAIAAGLLAASGGALKAQEKMTIGISYQNLAFPVGDDLPRSVVFL